jgi:hypothetical protein
VIFREIEWPFSIRVGVKAGRGKQFPIAHCVGALGIVAGFIRLGAQTGHAFVKKNVFIGFAQFSLSVRIFKYVRVHIDAI